MSVTIKLYKNNNETMMGTFGKIYGRAVVGSTVGTDTLAELIQENCSVKKSDVRAVLTELKSVIKQQLQDGHRVELEGLGAFRVGISTDGVDTADDFSVANVKHARILFQPEKTMTYVEGTRSDGTTGQVRRFVTDALNGITYTLISSSLTDSEVSVLAGDNAAATSEE